MEPFLVAMTLYVREGQEEAFLAFEDAALKRLSGHQGQVVARMRCAERSTGALEPYEFHLLSFPSEAAFGSFVASGVPYQDERDRVISKTTVVTGTPVTSPRDR